MVLLCLRVSLVKERLSTIKVLLELELNVLHQQATQQKKAYKTQIKN